MAQTEALRMLMESVDATRRQLAALLPAVAASGGLSSAVDDLQEITAASEQAATTIIEATDRIQGLAAELRKNPSGGACDEIEQQAMAIMMACSFQDLSAQRVMRISRLLREIEHRIGMLNDAWRVPGAPPAPPPPPTDERPDGHLLQGPVNRGAAAAALK